MSSIENVSASTPALDTEFADIELLHSISVELIGEHDSQALYGKIVDAAVSIMRSQFGTMQLLCPEGDPSGNGGKLGLLASRGLPPEAIKFWEWVGPPSNSSCTLALKIGKRAIVPDFEEWDDIAGSEELSAFRGAGIRSAQTTPLVSRNGDLLGMISTHWSEPHTPSMRDLRLMDILARQAADLLERTMAEEALRAREELQNVLTGELSHRVKNMLATVQAIATQTLRHSKSSSDFVASFGGRIQSMSRVHAQLSDNEWKGTQLRDLVQDQMKLGPADETRISASGPDVRLDAGTVPKMAMIMHELGTNSIKYGALSRTKGTVTIGWTVSDGTLQLEWTERGGPKVEAPIRRGFGTALIEQSAVGAGGKARMLLEADGVQWEIKLPLPQASVANVGPGVPEGRAERGPRALLRTGGRSSKTLGGKRVLIVEDEPLVAMEIADYLQDAGASIVGPAGNVSDALGFIAREQLDAALLDANLSGVPIDEIAAALTRKNVPFAFVSGYGRESLPQSFAAAETLPKPFSAQQLLELASRLVDERAHALRKKLSVHN